MSKHYVIDCNGNPIKLGSELGKGGEGIVYNIQNDPTTVAKIYLKPPDQEKSHKILSMVGASNERLLKLAAWPLKSIHSQSQHVVGFVMQKLQGYRPIFELYGPKLRLQKFPDADWRFLIHSATNTARAFSVVHEAGHVIGDVNHGNLFVANDATVKFIDTDSFQISIKGKNWLCEVGVGTHQPPEMQGQSTYKGIIRTPNQDNFGLAVLIFQLLCLARHPFSGRFSGHGDMPIEKAITECRFAYARDNRFTQMIPPPASLSMNALSPRIWLLFERAFAKEGSKNAMRPTAKEWISALEELSGSLKVCQSNQGHHYISSLTTCPWCDIEVKGSTILFPIIVKSHNSLNGTQNFHTLWMQMAAVQDPGPAPVLPDIRAITVPPSKQAQEIAQKLDKLKKRLIMFFGLVIISILAIGCCGGPGIWQLLAGGIGACGFIFYKDKKDDLMTSMPSQYLMKDMPTQVLMIKERWQTIASNWVVWTDSSGFTSIRRDIDKLKQQYERLQEERKWQHQLLWDNRRHQQLIAYLDCYRIDQGNISGIGASRAVTLQSHGIETAADLDISKIEWINGFGPKLIRRLMDWKNQCARGFVFDAKKGVSVADTQAIERDIAVKTRKIEQDLSSEIKRLQTISNQIQKKRNELYTQATSLIKTHAQTLADARAMGINI